VKAVFLRHYFGRRNQRESVQKLNTSVRLQAVAGRKGVQGHPNIPRHVLLMNAGTRFAVFFFVMNKNSQILRRPQKLSLGDLILAVSSCTKSSRETVATVADLLGSGRVRVEDHGRFLRAKVC
jgi:hypothetical protein